MDVHDKKTRSYNMSMIKGKDTMPEAIVRKYLFAAGFRYRKNYRKLPGTPDIVLAKYKTVIFVNGCFWHAHEGCPSFVWPETKADFWKDKLLSNRIRDIKKKEALEQSGWKVIVLWECELKPKNRERTLKDLVTKIKER